MNTEQASNDSSPNPQPSKPTPEQALWQLQQRFDCESKMAEIAFIEALQGKAVREIGRYQVYTDFENTRTVVFIHNPTGWGEHKYIFAITEAHTYIVAAPTEWTAYHKEILARVSAASGERACCSGGGYISLESDGSLTVDRTSGDFGEGDHQLAQKAFREAVLRTGKREDPLQ